MTDTERDLIQRMATELDLYRQLLRDDCTSTHPLADEARTALDQPEPEGLTDEEILNLSQEHQVSFTMCDGGVIYPLQEGADMKDDVLSFARALIAADRARWGRPAVEPETNGQT
jgi:hypothetical protein